MKINQDIISNNGNNTQHTGSFYNRVVELSTPINIGTALAAVTAYMLNTPALIIGVGVGTIYICKKLYERCTEVKVANPIVVDSDPFTKEVEIHLEQTKSEDFSTRTSGLVALRYNCFHKVSEKNQIAITKAMLLLLEDHNTVTTFTMQNDYQASDAIKGFIQHKNVKSSIIITAVEGLINYLKLPENSQKINTGTKAVLANINQVAIFLKKEYSNNEEIALKTSDLMNDLKTYRNAHPNHCILFDKL